MAEKKKPAAAKPVAKPAAKPAAKSAAKKPAATKTAAAKKSADKPVEGPHTIQALGKDGAWMNVTKHESEAHAKAAMSDLKLNPDKFRVSPLEVATKTGVSDTTKPADVKFTTPAKKAK